MGMLQYTNASLGDYFPDGKYDLEFIYFANICKHFPREAVCITQFMWKASQLHDSHLAYLVVPGQTF